MYVFLTYINTLFSCVSFFRMRSFFQSMNVPVSINLTLLLRKSYNVNIVSDMTVFEIVIHCKKLIVY